MENRRIERSGATSQIETADKRGAMHRAKLREAIRRYMMLTANKINKSDNKNNKGE